MRWFSGWAALVIVGAGCAAGSDDASGRGIVAVATSSVDLAQPTIEQPAVSSVVDAVDSSPVDVVVGLEWEAVEGTRIPPPEHVVVTGGVAFGKDVYGWLSTSTDFLTWTRLPVPEGVKNSSVGWLLSFRSLGDGGGWHWDAGGSVTGLCW